ncbi:hypothetical protein B0T25DRAFT_612183 [Lasiosphaeria hispida]|uniref:AAA+ ATPase domain-containing protein n=1 Tax=Lasiosphaeria hispida TaxID=260671 RepID=A0AAJ0HAG5_9PEZI|nr:hypothetical protein B0T25DRAFT_612183 [Lasiosphaeria hispida]
MSDLFSSLGASSLLRDLQAALATLERLNILVSEPEVTNLCEQIGDLVDIVLSFDNLATQERRHPTVHLKFRSAQALLHLQTLLSSTTAIIDECSALFIRPLQSNIEDLARTRDATGPSYIAPNDLVKEQSWYDEAYNGLRLLTEVLRVLFTAIDLLNHQHGVDDDAQSLEARSSTSTQLHFQISLVEQRLHLVDGRYDATTVRNAVEAARAVTVHIPPVPNQHFVIARPVRTYFTGRKAHLAKLEAAFRDPTRPIQQKFVIYGLSGSGKTELAFKFADEYRNKFWGVFFVDGSSKKNVSSSYTDIATLGGVEPNEKAAKNWLATRALPWLLIVDNVDGDEIDIEELLPQGTKGCVLITTRNPAHMTYGNVGDRYMELLPMEPDEAESLLIKAAEVRRPWPQLVVESAGSICRALGFLPLALVQAAKAMLSGICEWPDYLKFYDHQIERIRRTLHSRKRSSSRGRKLIDYDANSISVFSTYEILYESLQSSTKEKCQDAVELLHVFSYFHFQNIRLDVLINSAINPLREEEQQKMDDMQDRETQKKLAKPPRKPWAMVFRELRAFLNGKLSGPAPMPGVLRNRDGFGLMALEDEVNVRLRHALSVLIERSLVVRQDRATGRYSMHPLIHKWVRERPEMSTSLQALWCQVSITTLASSIQRPPHGDSPEECRTRRELLPHIRHVRECQVVIDRRLEQNLGAARAKAVWRPVWTAKKSYGRLQTDQDVRFSRVYAESGHFAEARELQERALEFVSARLGPDHPIAIRLSLLLTHTMWEMSEIDKATQRQRHARQLCINTWGEDHPLTLDVTDLLGSALYFKGRWAEATALHADNVQKMTKLYGEKHEKTLKSIRNLGRMYFRYMDYEKARSLYLKAWNGMREILGETHLETLTSLEDLATCCLRHDEEPEYAYIHRKEEVTQSHKDMLFVYEKRKELLGKEHPYTLLAILYLARLKSEGLGQHVEAEVMLREGIMVAERNVGKEHLAVLMAKNIYAEVLTSLKRFSEAEDLFKTLIDKKWYKDFADEDGDHPDRLSSLWFFTRCLEAQGKIEQTLEICDELIAGLTAIGGKGQGTRHVILTKTREKVARLREQVPKAHVERAVTGLSDVSSASPMILTPQSSRTSSFEVSTKPFLRSRVSAPVPSRLQVGLQEELAAGD